MEINGKPLLYYSLRTFDASVADEIILVTGKNDIDYVREEIVEKEDGKRKVKLVNIYPSYVFIKMIYSNQVWYYITSTNGVTSFVGPGGRPAPLTPEEVKKTGLEAIKIEDFNIKVGDNVEIISGALAGFVGKVDEIYPDREKVKVTVPMFGRQTPVEVEFSNVEKVK